jgi:hypothetical protein
MTYISLIGFESQQQARQSEQYISVIGIHGVMRPERISMAIKEQ